MWNMVNVDGQWYAIDCTWDDPDFNDKTVLYHDYFMLKMEDISETHTLDYIYTDFMECGL